MAAIWLFLCAVNIRGRGCEAGDDGWRPDVNDECVAFTCKDAVCFSRGGRPFIMEQLNKKSLHTHGNQRSTPGCFGLDGSLLPRENIPPTHQTVLALPEP